MEKMLIEERAVYSAAEVAQILGRSCKYVRKMCNTGRLAAIRDRGGFMIGGWALRAFIEGRSVIK